MPVSTADEVTYRPRAIVFDWDNTLVDTWPVIHAALSATFEAMDQEPWTLAQTKQRVAKSLRESFPDLFGRRWEEAAAVFYESFGSVHLDRLKPLDHAHATLVALTETGLPCFIVSNKTSSFLHKEVDHLGWTDFIHTIIGATDAEKDKPDPAPMYMALDGTGLTPSRDIWYVGDSLIDLDFAEATGCLGILVHTASAKPEAAAKADIVVDDLAELMSVFNRLPSRGR